ncbi:MAG: A24 family peptidase [Candidatus Promineifilaceae bacterium]
MMPTVTLILLSCTGAGVGWFLNQISNHLVKPPTAVAPSRKWGWFAAAFTAALVPYFVYQAQWLNLAIGLFFLLIALIDSKYRLIPNRLVYPALLLTLLGQYWRGSQPFGVVLLGGGLAFTTFALAAWLRPGQLGGGDVKLAALIGCLFGFPAVLWPLLIGIVTGGLAAALLLYQGYNRHYQIPYAPFLCLGVFLALL